MPSSNNCCNLGTKRGCNASTFVIMIAEEGEVRSNSPSPLLVSDREPGKWVGGWVGGWVGLISQCVPSLTYSPTHPPTFPPKQPGRVGIDLLGRHAQGGELVRGRQRVEEDCFVGVGGWV